MKISLISALCSWQATAFVLHRNVPFAKLKTVLRMDAIEAPVLQKHCFPLDTISIDEVPKFGGKTASLGEMIQQLVPLGVNVPNGFGLASSAYDELLNQFHLRERLELLLEDIDVTNLDNLSDRGRQARQMILSAGLPNSVRKEIMQQYDKLGDGNDVSVAVRSSATAEDLPNASFAGQQASYLNVVGKEAVCQAVLECLASIFTDRAITYRVQNGFGHMDVKGAVVVQKMVRSDLASAGVAFTLDPDTGFRDVVVITGSYGLGESVVGGKVDPDEVQVFKPVLGTASDPIIRRTIGRKQTKIIYTRDRLTSTKQVETLENDQIKPSFSDEDAKILAKWCVDIENHYSKKNGYSTPMDIEWAKDGQTGELFIVQARPETVRSRQVAGTLKQTKVDGVGQTVVEGTAIGSDAACGQVHVFSDLSEISSMKPGEVLVADMTDPDWVPAIRMASAVVTNRGGRTCHAAIVSRELGVPCICGSKNAMEKLKTGEHYTVDCTKGNTGYVYEGSANIKRTDIDMKDIPATKTKVQLILGDPDSALSHSNLPVAGVGLTRQEFVIANHIGIHPNACINPDDERVTKEDRKIILEKSANDPSPEAYYVRKLTEGLGTIAAAFYPRPIIVRLSDFKSNEYSHMIGGQGFEPKEENPMIGLRGASRYLHPDFAEAFRLECEALAHVRDNMGLNNVQLMVPFCRTPEEGKQVIQTLAKYGLHQGENGLKVWVMCELPSNVLAFDEFADVFDGFSIGSNDLTQLILGADRDSSELANVFDEENVAVKKAISIAIEGATRRNMPIGLCGQAPSDKPDFAAFLVEKGITSISVTPDSVLKAIDVVAKAESHKLAVDEISAAVGKVRSDDKVKAVKP